MEQSNTPEFTLIYWTGNFAGRGEFVRLLLEASGATYRDVSREGAEGL